MICLWSNADTESFALSRLRPRRREPLLCSNLQPDDYSKIIEASIRAFLDQGKEAGAAVLTPIAGRTWLGLRSEGRRVELRVARGSAAAVVTLPTQAQQVTNPSRHFLAVANAAIYRRDRFQCRYCGIRVIPLGVLSALASVYPAQLPYNANYKAGETHRMFWTNVPEVDHVEAGGRGGDWRDPANQVTACVVCNTLKSDHSLSALVDWQLRDPADVRWDGLLSLYRPLWERAGKPAAKWHETWLRAFEGNAR